MSGSGKDPPINGGDEEEDGDDGPTKMGGPKVQRNEGKCKGCGRKGKKIASFFQFRKSQKQIPRKKQRVNSVNSGCLALRVFGGIGGGVEGPVGGCCFCLKKPETLESSDESPTSDPNSGEFTYEMLRDLIEKNDFYSKECNGCK